MSKLIELEVELYLLKNKMANMEVGIAIIVEHLNLKDLVGERQEMYELKRRIEFVRNQHSKGG